MGQNWTVRKGKKEECETGRVKRDVSWFWMKLSPAYLLYLLRLFSTGLSPSSPPSLLPSICQTDSCWQPGSVVVHSVLIQSKPSVPPSPSKYAFIFLLCSIQPTLGGTWDSLQFTHVIPKLKEGLLWVTLEHFCAQTELALFVAFIVGDGFASNCHRLAVHEGLECVSAHYWNEDYLLELDLFLLPSSNVKQIHFPDCMFFDLSEPAGFWFCEIMLVSSTSASPHTTSDCFVGIDCCLSCSRCCFFIII